MLEKILISACLWGKPVRYDGRLKTLHHHLIDHWRSEGRLVPFCPEMAAGLSAPRLPAEIAEARSGKDVLAGIARVIQSDGIDVTDNFIAGANLALSFAQKHDCRYALLIDGSPSCGSKLIYDGHFSGQQHPGIGVTAALFMENGIEIFTPEEIELLAEQLALSP